jgi:sialic acid synthase SpsE
LGFDTIKIASYDCASFQMLREVKEHFGTIIVSTGATFDDEIERATAILDGSNFALLHCVTIYPTPIEQLHLTRLEFLRNYCDKVGFSDHTLVARDGLIGSKASLALGADIIERHFTLLEPDQTKDGPVSINPQQLRELADFAALPVESRLQVMDKSYPQWRQTIGKQNRFLSDIELSNRDYFRGRFASRRPETKSGAPMIFNWEEVPLP